MRGILPRLCLIFLSESSTKSITLPKLKKPPLKCVKCFLYISLLHLKICCLHNVILVSDVFVDVIISIDPIWCDLYFTIEFDVYHLCLQILLLFFFLIKSFERRWG